MKMFTRLSLSAALTLSPLSLMGQAHDGPKTAAPVHEAATQGHESAAHGEPAAAGHEAEAPGHAVEAAEAGEGHGEAHGETHGGGHHGPAMKLFGKEYGNLGAFLVQLLNFAIYAGALFFLLKGVLSAMFKARKEELETLLSQSERDKAEGEAQVKALEAKMAGLEGDLAGILSRAEVDAEAEKQRVLEAARAEATLILAQAQAEIDHQKRQAEQELRALVAELAVEGAAQRLAQKLQGPEAGKALDRAIEQIGGVQ